MKKALIYFWLNHYITQNKDSLSKSQLICYGNMSKTMIFHMKLGIIWDLTMEKLKNMIFLPTLLAEKYLLVNELKNAKIHIKRVKEISKDRVLLNKVADLEKEIRKRESK